MMKKNLLLLVVLALALPMAAFADDCCDVTFDSTGGTLVGNSNGFTLTGGTLTSVSGFGYGYVAGANLGSVTFTTGFLGPIGNVNTGSPIMAGGTITLTGNGSDPTVTGTLLTGTFTGGTWSTDGQGDYYMSMIVTGQTGTGSWATGTFTMSLTQTPGFYGSSSDPNSVGYTSVAVPEPGELSLMGTGLLGLMGAIRRKLKR